MDIIEPGRGFLLFVYGTMLSRGRNHSRLYESRAIRIGDKFLTEDVFAMYLRSKNGAPCAVSPTPDRCYGFPIEGELYAVPSEAVETIDAFEGHPYVYERKPVLLQGFRGALVEMYHYVKPLDSDPPLAPDHEFILRYDP